MADIEEKENVSDELKLQILQEGLRIVHNTIYKFVVEARIAKKIADEEMQKAAISQLDKFEKMKDLYEVEIAELKSGMVKHE